jgi:uncharacterized membrane protein YbhN (UPF0104 family)
LYFYFGFFFFLVEFYNTIFFFEKAFFSWIHKTFSCYFFLTLFKSLFYFLFLFFVFRERREEREERREKREGEERLKFIFLIKILIP